MTRRRLVAGNWKMHGSAEHVDVFADALASRAGESAEADLLVCPPFVYIERLARRLEGTGVAIGGQNVCDKAGPGAFTGEVSAAMLADAGCSHAIVGHSERRALYGEDDETVAEKFGLAREAGLTPILCVGESLAERDAGETEGVLRRQLGGVLADCGAAAFEGAVIAYEPVWAIGTGRSASAEQAQAAHVFLRHQIAAEDDILAGRVRILYGGSVKAENAAGLFAGEDVDGGLVGGASLDAASFLEIAAA